MSGRVDYNPSPEQLAAEAFRKIDRRFLCKADLVNGKVPIEQLPLDFSTYTVQDYDALNLQFPQPQPVDMIVGVRMPQGVPFIGVLWGANYKPKGLYISTGTTWEFFGEFPQNLTQVEVDAGLETRGYVNALTLANYYKWSNVDKSKAVGDTYTAGEVINGGKALIMDTDSKVYMMDITNPAHYERYIGISAQSAIANDPIKVVSQGKTDVLGSGWLPGVAYYIDATGYLSATPPAVGFTKKVGVGVDNDIIALVNGTEFITI